MTLTRIAYPSPNYSSRGGAAVRLLVLHTAEGARTIESLGSFFANPAAGVSSHAGADDKVNTIGVYVKRAPDKAWTQGGANPVAVSLELCGFAAWDNAEWHRHPNMLANCAAWLAEEAAAFNVPLVALTAAQAQGSGRGVCQHVDLGSWGGGHVDCGSGFPMDEVISMAKGGAAPVSSPSGGSELSPVCILTAPGRVDQFVVGTDHRVWQATGQDLNSLATADWGAMEDARATAVSAAWTADYDVLYVTVRGTDGRPWTCAWKPSTGWSNWLVNPKAQLLE